MKFFPFTLTLSASALAASAQNYSIDWFMIAGGTNNPATVPATFTTKFHRLMKP
jgi:hypothetical protein